MSRYFTVQSVGTTYALIHFDTLANAWGWLKQSAPEGMRFTLTTPKGEVKTVLNGRFA